MADTVVKVSSSFWRYLDLCLGSAERRVRGQIGECLTKKFLTFRLCERFRSGKEGPFLLFAESPCGND